jgi:uncharacterized protein YdhG (YjbR/CyaY superfamily)
MVTGFGGASGGHMSTMPRSAPATIDAYIAGFPEETQALLEEVRALIHAEAPEATETISYAIPTFDLDGKHLCHFAAFKKHLSFFPTSEGAEAFAAELERYKGGRGTVQFPYGEPLPTDLIRRMVAHRVEQVRGSAA